jgi:hypothetical protein
MSCTCLTDLPRKVAERLGTDAKFPGPIKSVEFDSLSWVIEDNSVTRMVLSNQMTIKYEYTAKSGAVSIKKLKRSMMPSFCPFCGEKLTPGTDEGGAA